MIVFFSSPWRAFFLPDLFTLIVPVSGIDIMQSRNTIVQLKIGQSTLIMLRVKVRLHRVTDNNSVVAISAKIPLVDNE